ncbi:MAG: methyltransferase domain-containing protein [Methylobacteriaceae bacterium]|nr:methyltransferase domain-containing protein [Methylobacteriaceae bacterium]
MTGPPPLFDRALIRRRLARAARKPASFLLDRVAIDFAERLSLVSRPFPRALDLGTPGPQIAETLEAQGRIIVRAAPIIERPHSPLLLIGDEEALPFASESFDLIVSGLCLQWANDLPGALVQIRRALAPDGLFLAALAGGQSLIELRTALTSAEAQLVGGASPRVAPFADIRDLGHLLQRAGFALPVTDVEPLVARYDSMLALMRDLRAMGATNALAERSRVPLRRDVLLRAVEIYAERFADQDGRVRATFDIVWLSGWAPHESQQKPLAPGSARVRLADALNVSEGRLPRD